MDNQKDFAILSSLFRNFYSIDPDRIVALAGAGSNRGYFRIISDKKGISCIGVKGTSFKENKSFIDLSGVFRNNGINVPEVFAVDESGIYYLQQDLGDISLFSLLSEAEVASLVKESLFQLVEIQTLNENEWEPFVISRPFSKRQVMWDLNYFKYEFLKTTGIEFDEEKLEDDFEQLSQKLINRKFSVWGFMYRDFQSRNVMINNGQPWLIDFQGGRPGPVVYDIVSFLWQAKANFSKTFRNEMLDYYSKIFFEKKGVEKSILLSGLNEFVLFRTLQVLGAYGLRGIVERKAHFIESIKYTLRNLSELLENGQIENYPELKRCVEAIIKIEKFSPSCHEGLKVKIFSFSYKKGYPEDFTGNGGGFMFDCRAMHNPGRYPEFKSLTGLDDEVKEYLKERGEADEFVKKSFDMVEIAVDRYLKRGFSDLQIGFGCTGGQHRSVYCAESLADLLSVRFPELTIEVIHRERGIKRIISPKHFE